MEIKNVKGKISNICTVYKYISIILFLEMVVKFQIKTQACIIWNKSSLKFNFLDADNLFYDLFNIISACILI